MNRLVLLIFAAFIVATSAISQRMYLSVDFKAKRVAPAIGTDLLSIEKVGGKWDLAVVGLAGSTLEGGSLYGGFGITTRLPFAKNYDIQFGPYIHFEAGRVAKGGVLVSLVGKF